MVEIRNLNFRYKKNKTVFENLQLSLPPGHIYGLLGKNGAGKSTLIKHICGLLTPQTGQCMVFDYKAEERNTAMLEDIFLIPEEFELPSQSLALYVRRNSVFYPKYSEAQFQRYLQEFELSRDTKLTDLSYGQKKKFLLAFGLACNGRVLILDEPTNGLDIPSKSQFRKIVATAMDEEKIIIISTHQVRDLESMIDYVLVLENGRIVFSKDIGTISEKLSFESNLNGHDQVVLYEEEMAGRKAGIVLNKSGLETRVDLELLFNGLVKNSSNINQYFNN
ncbi:MAG TPA: ABC transporter ATP-binding protein [Cytophagaceae bacterium]|jgi:ABC-2 type transport system ATP-binding protein